MPQHNLNKPYYGIKLQDQHFVKSSNRDCQMLKLQRNKVVESTVKSENFRNPEIHFTKIDLTLEITGK